MAEPQWEDVAEVEYALGRWRELAGRLAKELRMVLPMTRDGTCFYCSLGSVAEGGRHFDEDNLWDGDQSCLKTEKYESMLAALAEYDRASEWRSETGTAEEAIAHLHDAATEEGRA